MNRNQSTDTLVRRRRSLMRRAAGRVARRFSLPWSPLLPDTVQLVPSNACNFRCRACPKTVYDSDNRMLDPEVYERVRVQLLPYARVLNLQGLGEPMLSDLFFPMMREARRLGLRIVFVTNGSKLDAENVPELVASPVDMTVSIDGVRAATHEDSRPGAHFDALIEALEMLRRALDGGAHPDFRWHINTVVTTRNVDEVEGILEMAHRYGATTLHLIVPAVEGREDAFARETIGHHLTLLRQQVAQLQARATELGVRLELPPFVTASADGAGKGVGAKTDIGGGGLSRSLFPGRCFDPWRTVYIDVDGSVRPCCRAVWLDMGNILEEDFTRIWNGPHYRRLRRAIHSDAPPDFCRGCTLHHGITLGDERYVEKLEQRGIRLAPPPSIGRS